MLRKVFKVALPLLALFSTAALAVDDATAERARELFQQGLQEEEANERAVAEFERLMAAEPVEPWLLAYRGSAETLRARDVWMPWEKMRHVDKGLALLDKAQALLKPEDEARLVGRVPVAAEVRLVAANTYIALPGMFNTFEKGRGLAEQLVADPRFAAWPAPFQVSVLLCGARAAQGAKNGVRARELLNRARPLARGRQVAAVREVEESL